MLLGLSDVVSIMLLNLKMPMIVGILTFMSKINFMLYKNISQCYKQIHAQLIEHEISTAHRH